MTKYKNTKRDSFLASIIQASIDNDSDCLSKKCKFNFSYFDIQDAGQSFDDWDQKQISKLLNKLKDYCNEPLSYWKNKPIGKSGTVLAIYGTFPKNSDFTHPKHVPHQAQWGRFRIESAVRLVGFVLPDEYHDKAHARTGYRFDCNTFYVVFLDAEHKFYKTEKN
jgi:hypothetical protein